MAMESLAGLITPLIASAILKFFGDNGYTILAWLDVISALALVILTLQLRELNIYEKLTWRKESLRKNIDTAKIAIKNVMSNPSLRLLLIYRSLANHVAFIFIISLPSRYNFLKLSSPLNVLSTSVVNLFLPKFMFCILV